MKNEPKTSGTSISQEYAKVSYYSMIEEAFSKLNIYCLHQNYHGWDLFDGLNSELFQRLPLKRSKLLQLAWIQFFKRSPINFRSTVRVPKGYNAKGLGLFTSGMAVLDRLEEARKFLELLIGMTCEGYSGVSWGYNFPWRARSFYVPVGKPNMVTTVFVANAFLDFADKVDSKDLGTLSADRCREIAVSCCEFILNQLVIFEDSESLCFGYIPGEVTRVYNASMLGAALLGRVFGLTGNVIYYEKSSKAINYVIRALNPEYSWPYGERSHHTFIDNFHTGFNIVALRDWMVHTGDHRWEEDLKRSYSFYLNNFWLTDGCPKYYNTSLYPLDIHCSAQGIITCLKLKNYDDHSIQHAEKVALWAINHMQSPEGFFYYQKTRLYTNRISYIRWSQAWMFYALAHYLAHSIGCTDHDA